MLSDRISDAFAPKATERGRARPNMRAAQAAPFRGSAAVTPDELVRACAPQFATATTPRASADCDQMLVRPRRIKVFLEFRFAGGRLFHPIVLSADPLSKTMRGDAIG